MHDSLESYAIIDQNRLVTRKEIIKQMNTKLPNSIEELLFGELLKNVKNNHTSMSEPIDTYRFLPPLSNPSKIICLGYNYLDHAKEQGTIPPDEPIVFMKPRTTLIGTGDNIVCPKFVTQLDYEGELAFVIGNKCKNVKPEEAMKYVLGYMIFNDVSARDIQFKESQWTKSKSFDTFAPSGPWLTTKDEIADPHNLRIITKVNGEIRQDSSTKNMALKIDKIVTSLSKIMTLEEGDIIATGTPSGVAAFMTNPKFLQDGDIVEIEIEGLGKISNSVTFID
ncbi:MAG: 2-keto-4-pentenoate hydratase [Thaumarchaeota archaeon]|nr:2-keto-4-pentenoate hydratase [Nitrososphaerota archaeon]